MNALENAKRHMKWKEEWREKVNNEADQELADHYRDMEDVCRADAITYAAIAQAEATRQQNAELRHIAGILGYWLNQETMPLDPREPGQSWDEYRQQQAGPPVEPDF